MARGQRELGGHLTVVGDLNVHAGSTEMEEWGGHPRGNQTGHGEVALLLANGREKMH
jgi:hypothetical protein